MVWFSYRVDQRNELDINLTDEIHFTIKMNHK